MDELHTKLTKSRAYNILLCCLVESFRLSLHISIYITFQSIPNIAIHTPATRGLSFILIYTRQSRVDHRVQALQLLTQS